MFVESNGWEKSLLKLTGGVGEIDMPKQLLSVWSLGKTDNKWRSIFFIFIFYFLKKSPLALLKRKLFFEKVFTLLIQGSITTV